MFRLHIGCPEWKLRTPGQIGWEGFAGIINICSECPTRHTETSLARLGLEEVHTHLVGDHALGSLILGLEHRNGVVTEGAEAGHAILVGTLFPARRLS